MARGTYLRFSTMLASVLGLAVVLGCSQETKPKASGKVEPADKGEKVGTKGGGNPTDVGLLLVTSKELEAAIQSHKGSIVVVDFWATWCKPCKEEFPHLIELHEKYGSKGVVCMSAALEEEEADAPKALKFLREKNAQIPNYLINEDPDARADFWKIKSIPVVIVYGRDGKKVKQFNGDDPDNQFSYADVNKLVEKLVSEKQ